MFGLSMVLWYLEELVVPGVAVKEGCLLTIPSPCRPDQELPHPGGRVEFYIDDGAPSSGGPPNRAKPAKDWVGV